MFPIRNMNATIRTLAILDVMALILLMTIFPHMAWLAGATIVIVGCATAAFINWLQRTADTGSNSDTYGTDDNIEKEGEKDGWALPDTYKEWDNWGIPDPDNSGWEDKQDKNKQNDNDVWTMGILKFFNPKKGYGFIVSRRYRSDIFFSYRNKTEGLSYPLKSGKRLLFQVQKTENGLKACNVTEYSNKLSQQQSRPHKACPQLPNNLNKTKKNIRDTQECTLPLHSLACIRDVCIEEDKERKFLNLADFNFFLHLYSCQMDGSLEHEDICKVVHCECGNE